MIHFETPLQVSRRRFQGEHVKRVRLRLVPLHYCAVMINQGSRSVRLQHWTPRDRLCFRGFDILNSFNSMNCKVIRNEAGTLRAGEEYETSMDKVSGMRLTI